MKHLLGLLRIKEYVKNIIVFAPLFFSAELFDSWLIGNTMLVFVAFCLLSSSVYIFNDLVDIQQDRQHPENKFRPLASGAVKKIPAIILAIALFSSSLGLTLFLNTEVLFVLLSYVGINILYSFWLKGFALVDVFVISLGIILRLLAGSLATGIVLSDWILLLTLFLSVFLVLGKRRQYLVLFNNEGNKFRKSLSGYSQNYIDLIMIMMASVIIAIYVMYSISPEVQVRTGSEYFKLTSVWIILAFMRYFQLIFVMGENKSPVHLFFEDAFLIIIVMLWVLSCFFLIYF